MKSVGRICLKCVGGLVMVGVVGCTPAISPLTEVTLGGGPALETSIGFVPPTASSPGALLVEFNRFVAGQSPLGWARSTDGVSWVVCNANPNGCSDGSVNVVASPPNMAEASFIAWVGDPALMIGPPGSGIAVMLDVAQYSNHPHASAIGMAVSTNSGQTFPTTLAVNVNDGSRQGQTDQEDGDMDDQGNFCIAWRHAWPLEIAYHPMARCGRVDPISGAVSFTTPLMDLPNGSFFGQSVGGISVRMIKHPANGIPHAVVVYSTPELGNAQDRTDCQGVSRYAGVRLFATESDISPTAGTGWSHEVLIHEERDYDYCPVQGVESIARIFGFAINPSTGARIVALPFNARPGSIIKPHVSLYEGNGSTWAFARSVSIDGNPNVSYFGPNLAVDDAGRVGLSFYGGEEPDFNRTASRWITASTDNGTTWLSPIRISSTTTAVRRNGFFLGDRSVSEYQSLTAVPTSLNPTGVFGNFYDAWTDMTVLSNTQPGMLPHVKVRGVRLL